MNTEIIWLGSIASSVADLATGRAKFDRRARRIREEFGMTRAYKTRKVGSRILESNYLVISPEMSTFLKISITGQWGQSRHRPPRQN